MKMFEQWENEDTQVAGSGVRFALEAGQDVDAAGAAKAFGMAKQLGMPEQAVLQDPRKAERELRAREIERNPFLARWAEEDALNAAFTRDDPELHGVFEHAAKLAKDISENIDGVGRSWERGGIALERMRLGRDKDFRERVRSGDPEAMAKMEDMNRRANPYHDQDVYGILHPGSLSPMQPLRQEPRTAKQPFFEQLAQDAASIITKGHREGQVVEDLPPLQQELDDIFSVAPHMHIVDGKVVLLQSMDAEGQHVLKTDAVAKWLGDKQHAGIFASPAHANAFLNLPAEKQRKLYAGWKEKPKETWVESMVGPGGAIEQLPRTIFQQLPTQAARANQGGAAGAVAGGLMALMVGNAGPQALAPEELITVPLGMAGGYVAGAQSGWLIGAGEAAYYSEYGSFVLEMAQERDANGQPLPLEAVEVASQSYALSAAVIEIVGEAAFLKLLKPLGLADVAAGQGVKGFIKSTVKRAALSKSQGMRFFDALIRLGISGLTEGGEEGAQEMLSILAGFVAKEGSNAFAGSNFIDNHLFTAEHAEQVGEAARAGAVAGVWMQGGPILLSGAWDMHKAQKAQQFVQVHVDFHTSVEATTTKQLSPDHMQSALEAAAPVLLEKVGIPADAALELYQSGIDIISPFGITEQEITDMAGKGHDMVVKISALHARLDAEKFEAAAQIMRRGDDAVSVADAVTMAERDSLNAKKVQEIYQQQVAEEEAYQDVRARLHADFVFSIESLPGLKAQAESQAGSVSAYLDNVLALADSVLPRLAAISGESKTELLSKIVPRMMEAKALNPVVDSINHANATADMLAAGFDFGENHIDEAGQEQFAKQYQRMPLAERSPALARIWGRLDGKSLKNYDSNGYKSVRSALGLGVFKSAENGGQSIDLLADELVRDGLLPMGSGAKELLAMLQDRKDILFQADMDALDYGRRVKEAAQKWVAQVKDFFDGKLNKRAILQLGQTSDILQRVGLPALPMVMGQDIAKKVTGQGKKQDTGHQLSHEHMEALVEELANPVMVLRAPNGNFVAVTDLWVNDAPVIVAIEPDASQGNIVVNDIRSAYGKSGFVGWLLNETANGRLLYLNKKRSAAFKDRSGLQLPRVLEKQRSSGKKIIYDNEVVKPLYGSTLDQAEGVTRGSVSIMDNEYHVRLMSKANLSTLPHEFGHVFLMEWQRIMESGIDDKATIADWQTLKNWLGAEEGQGFTREQHEKFARGFETYLMEGKAPSIELEGVFNRFKRWLLTIYKSAKSLNLQINDEVRGVFDRMISTEKEIAAAAAKNELLDLTTRELDALGITGPARIYAQNLMQVARQAAAENLERTRNRDRATRRNRYAAEAKKELENQQVYKARSAMRQTPLDVEAVREMYGDEVVKALRRSLPMSLRMDGMDPEIFAALQGYASGQEMIMAVTDSTPIGKAINKIVDEKDAVYDAEQSPAIELLETEQVNEQVAMVGKYLAQNLGKQHVQQEAFTMLARRELAGMSMSEVISAARFMAAVRRALRQERLAISEGDFATALEANHKARLNMEFARQSRKVEEAQGVTARRIERFVNMSKGNPDARFSVMDIGVRHGLAKWNGRLAEGRDSSTIRDWLHDVEAEGYTIYADEAVLHGHGKAWRGMTVTEYENLAETINQIITVERNQRQLLTVKGAADLDTVAENIVESIHTHRTPKSQKTVEKEKFGFLKNLHAIHTKVENFCIALDGDSHGPTWEHIYKPIATADDAQAVRLKNESTALKNLFGKFYTRKELVGAMKRKEIVKEIGEPVTFESRLAVALNMGNEVNKSRIKEGHGWSDEQLEAILWPLKKKDWEFVQAVWDYLATFKADAFAVEQEITGLRPVAVEALPLAVQTADGEVVQLQGGYYPIAYNAEKSTRAFAQQQKQLDKELFGGRNYGSAMTRQGHLKERAKGGMGSPLLLELSVITDHVFNVVHDISYRKAVLDVAKVIRHPKVCKAIESTVGKDLYRELMPWLQDAANERQEPMHAVHRLIRWARASTTIMQMGYKFTTMFTQPLGFTQSVVVLGYKYAGAGLKKVYKNPLALPALIKTTNELSPFMANRIKSFDREIRDFTKKLMPAKGRFAWVDVVKDNAFVPMGYFQLGVDLPTWWGAHEKALAELKMDEIAAREYADSIVRMSQGSGSTKDLARIQRGGELARTLTMFYSYFNTFYNLAARSIMALNKARSPESVFRAANAAMLLWFIPSVLSELVAGRGPDDDEEPWKWAAVNMMQYPFQAVVGVRDVANAVFETHGYQITAAASAPKSVVTWLHSVNKALENEDPGAMARPSAEALGYAFGLPMKQGIITAGNVWDYLTGEDPEFEVRDLFFVKPKSRRQ